MESVAQPPAAWDAVSEHLGVMGCDHLCKPGHRGEGPCSPSGCPTLPCLEQDQQDRREGNPGPGTLPIKDLSPG